MTIPYIGHRAGIVRARVHRPHLPLGTGTLAGGRPLALARNNRRPLVGPLWHRRRAHLELSVMSVVRPSRTVVVPLESSVLPRFRVSVRPCPLPFRVPFRASAVSVDVGCGQSLLSKDAVGGAVRRVRDVSLLFGDERAADPGLTSGQAPRHSMAARPGGLSPSPEKPPESGRLFSSMTTLSRRVTRIAVCCGCCHCRMCPGTRADDACTPMGNCT